MPRILDSGTMQHGSIPPFGRLRRWTQVAGLAYVAGIILLTGLFRGFGERWWLISPLLFVPIQLWLAPLALLIPAAWKFERRLLPFFAFALLLALFGIAGLRFGTGAQTSSPGASPLIVLTYNTGEDNNTSVEPFVRSQAPDLILLQAVTKQIDYQHLQYPGCHLKVMGEFVLISRFPILGSKLITTGKPQWKKPLAAAFTLDWQGRAITVYTVHVPTLRREFDRLTGKRDPQQSKRNRITTFRDDMRDRVEMNELFARMLASESGPLIVAGDFNMPASGYLHAQYASRLSDAFGVTGRGFGFTFPGFDPYLPTFFGTWLRLDYIFCNSAWRPLSCTVEKGRASQHRAVAATFELKEPKQR